MIRFQCPNGHPLSTTDDRAGTAAKCPKCQAPVVVPAATNGEAQPSDSGKQTAEAVAAGNSGKMNAEAGKSGPQPASPAPAASPTPAPVPHPDLVVFLCPNGHKLNGPARMKGKAGQCPHCGAKFRIPDDDDEEDIDEFEEVEEHVAESMTDEEFAAEDVEDIEEITEFEDEEELQQFEDAPLTVIDAFLHPLVDEDLHPYAAMLSQLWAAKEPGQAIDLYLQKGEVFTPETFAPSLSQPLYGIFGRREKDGGGQALIMLPWDNITRIEVRHVKQIPVGLLK